MQRNNGLPACASCKHQRKKCTEKCVLAPLFPADKNQEFQAVHKVFGVSNVTKIVKNLREEDRRKAIDSLVWEAICRQKDPVLGPYGEYRKVCEELKVYRNQTQHFQVPTQGSMVYKSAPSLGGWNNNINGMCNKGTSNIGGTNHNKNTLNYLHNNGSSIPYNYSLNHHIHNMDRARQEKDAGSIVILPQQQNSINGFNQPYYLSGQFGSIDAYPLESSLWEGSS